MKERKQSVWLELWIHLQALRAVRLSKLGRFSEPESQAIEKFSAQLKRAAEMLVALAGDGEDLNGAGPVYVELAWEEFLDEQHEFSRWARDLVPAFPLHAFANSTVLQRCWAAAEKRIADEAELARYEARRTR